MTSPEFGVRSIAAVPSLTWLVLATTGCGLVLGIEDDERIATHAGGVGASAGSPSPTEGGKVGAGGLVQTGGVAGTGGAEIASGGDLLASGGGEPGGAEIGGSSGGAGGEASGGVPEGGAVGAAGNGGASGAAVVGGAAAGGNATGGLGPAGAAGASHAGGLTGGGEAGIGGASLGGSGGVAGGAGHAGHAGAPSCDPLQPFGTHVPMDALNTEDGEGAARVTADGKTLYFGRGTFDWSELRVASRESESDPFESSSVLMSTATAPTTGVYGYGGASVTEDQLTMVFGCFRAGSWDVCSSSRSSTLGSWSTPQVIESVSTTGPDMDPTIRFDGLELFFARGGAPGDPVFIMVATRPSLADDFGAPALVAALREGGDRNPTLSHDGLTLYFSSVRANEHHQGWLDIWKTTRPSLDGDWGDPVIVPDLSSPYNDALGSLSADGCTAYLSQGEPNIRWEDLLEAHRCDCP